MIPPPNSRERFLAFGAQGAGKTRAWLDIARMHQLRGSDARFYVIDTDDSVGDMLAGERFNSLTNLDVHVCTSWGDIEEATAKIAGPNWKDTPTNIRPMHDWLIVDLGDKPWSWAQRAYTHAVYGKDLYDILLEQRMETEKKHVTPKSEKDPHKDKFGGLRGETDWVYVNALYDPWAEWVFLRSRAHVFVAAPITSVDDRADKRTKEMYGRFGVAAKGNKNLAYQARTVMLFSRFGEGESAPWVMTTVKDRERAQHGGTHIGDFALSYLMKTGGWRLT